MTQCGIHGSMEYVKQLEGQNAALSARVAVLEKAVRHIVQWSDAVWTSSYGGKVHPAWLDVQEGRAALDAAKEG